MSKFKVGDRVKITDASPFYCEVKVGDVAEVVSAESDDCITIDVRVASGKTHLQWARAHQIELLPAIRPGMRVRLTDDNGGWGEKGATGTVVRQGELGGWVVDLDKSYRCTGRVYVGDNIEPVGASLKIEAGKFYKTRDGRKVGPMVGPAYSGYWVKSVLSDEDGETYDYDGKCYYSADEDDNDLIAEWVEPAAVPVVAEKVTTRFTSCNPPAVGTRVKLVNGDEATVSRVAGNRLYVSDRRQEWCLYEDEGVSNCTLASAATAPTTPAIVCLIRNGQPVPATKPHVHPDRATAAVGMPNALPPRRLAASSACTSLSSGALPT